MFINKLTRKDSHWCKSAIYLLWTLSPFSVSQNKFTRAFNLQTTIFNKKRSFQKISRITDCRFRNIHRKKFHACSTQLLSSTNDEEHSNHKKQRSKKIILRNPEDFDLDALTAEFDRIAKKDGFDASQVDALSSKEEPSKKKNLSEIHDDIDVEVDYYLPFESESESMEDRIENAKHAMGLGNNFLSDELHHFGREVQSEDGKNLGFKTDMNPYGNRETPRKETFSLISDAMKCPACGTKFQTNEEMKPGYLPPEKFEIQRKLAKIEEAQNLQDKAMSDDWSPDDEVEWLLQQSDGISAGDDNIIDIDQMANELGIDLDELTEKKIICKRCHGLQNFGDAPESLRPGWSDDPTLSQSKFRDLLLPLREKPAVIVALVDLFDFNGSILPELDAIAGDNPVIIAANKIDLLPTEMGRNRVENWVRRELEYLGVKSIANIGGAVRLISCKTGFGIGQMLNKARKLAYDMNSDIYVVGAANAGKSTLINKILDQNKDETERTSFVKRRAGNVNKNKGAVTASPLPGTTLEFIKIDLGDGQVLYDTPGLLVQGTMTQYLTPAELKMVVPKKKVEPITFRVGSGKCVLIGGLARIEVIGDTKPFLFTFFVSNEIKLHPTSVEKADIFVHNHIGKLLTPPVEVEHERIIEKLVYHEVIINGTGWKEAAADISLRGIGWVAVTGAGIAKVRIGVPEGIGFAVRPPLMPFDVWEATAKYTGGRATRRISKSKNGKRKRGVGRR